MKKYKKIVALIMAGAMTLLASGCGNATETKQSSESSKPVEQKTSEASQPAVSQESSEEKPMEITKISLYGYSAALESGVREGYMKDLFARHGLEVEVWAFSADKTNAMLASGDLPDVMYVNRDQLETMIEGDMVLEFTDEHFEQIPNLLELENITSTLNYMREFRSAETGKLYAIPVGIGGVVSTGDTDRNTLRINWEYYEAVGCPEFDDLYDLIPILKQIQEKFPENELGNKVYAMANYYQPNGLALLRGYSYIFGYLDDWMDRLLIANMGEGTAEYLLQEDGVAYNALKWINTMNREGLYDPNSINYDSTAVNAKKKEKGTYILGLADVALWAPDYLQVYFEGQKNYVLDKNPYGSTYYIVINKETKNLDACLRLLNMFSDPDAYLEWRSMPEGEKWYVENGNVALPTEKFLDTLRNGTTFTMSTGEEYNLWNTMPIVSGGTSNSYVDSEGNPRYAQIENWAECLAITNDSPQMTSWKEHTGYDTWRELLKDKDALIDNSRLDLVNRFTSTLSDEQKLVSTACISTVVEGAWKMIYAENDTDFEKIWKQMVSDVEELGGKELYDWAEKDFAEALATKEALANK